MPRRPTVDTPQSLHHWCPVCDATPVVLVALRHPVMRRWTGDPLAAEHGCWDATQMEGDELLAEAIARIRSDLVVADDSDFPACCQAALDRMPPERALVVGPEPDMSYRTLALSNGAGGWVSRENVGDELSSAMRAALGCNHEPCPPSRPPAAGTTPGALRTGGRSR